MATKKTESKPKATAPKRRTTSTRSSSSRRTSQPRTSSAKTAETKSPPAAEGGRSVISLSSPLAQGTQIIATVRGLTPGETVVAHITGPHARSESLRLRADPSGQTQVFLHGPRAGEHSIAIKAASGSNNVDFEVK